MLRAAMRERTPLGLKVEQDMKAGNLVSDAIAIELVRERLRSDDCSKGFLLDGFPRTLAQAEEMRATGMAIDYVLKLDVPDSEIKRLVAESYRLVVDSMPACKRKNTAV